MSIKEIVHEALHRLEMHCHIRHIQEKRTPLATWLRDRLGKLLKK